MSEPMTVEQLADAREKIERAHTELGEVCAQGPSRRFKMSIPANPDRDTDLIIGVALSRGGQLLAEVERLRDENARLLGLMGRDALAIEGLAVEVVRLSRGQS